MKKITKSIMLAAALVLSLSVAGTSADAASKKPSVSKVASVDKLTGSKTITLAKGKKATLKTTVTVKNTKSSKYKKVTYKTSNKKVATVTSKGVITAKGAGKTTIKVTSTKNKKKYAKVTVKVVKGKVTKVSVDKTASVYAGEKVTLKATVKATKGANKTVKWTTSDESIATVTSKGVVTGVKAGTVKITATSTDGTSKKATCTVTVNGTTITPVDGKEVTVKATFKKDVKAADVEKDIIALDKISSDHEVVLTIDKKAYKVVVKDGKVTINGRALKDSDIKDITATVKIDVKKIAAVTAFAPASVDTVEVKDVKFSAISDKQVSINGTAYDYEVAADGKSIVIMGNVKDALKGLADVATIQ